MRLAAHDTVKALQCHPGAIRCFSRNLSEKKLDDLFVEAQNSYGESAFHSDEDDDDDDDDDDDYELFDGDGESGEATTSSGRRLRRDIVKGGRGERWDRVLIFSGGFALGLAVGVVLSKRDGEWLSLLASSYSRFRSGPAIAETEAVAVESGGEL